MGKKSAQANSIVNRKARHDYDIVKIFETGIVLSGAETKSMRQGHGHLRGAFVNIKDDELWLFNATITATNTNRNSLAEADQTRPRKLLIKHREINELLAAKQQGLTIIPLKILNKKRFIKLEIATARGLKKYDKRAKLKKRDQIREISQKVKYSG